MTLPPLSEPLARLQVGLAHCATQDWAAYDTSAAAVAAAGRRIISTATDLLTSPSTPMRVAAALADNWGQVTLAPLLDEVLILCADHELNLSTFTARCVASGRATPYAAVQAALAALSGARHGGHTARVAAMLDELSHAESVRIGLTGRLQRGDAIPGFGHPLYPDGDPRARLILAAVAAHTNDPVRLAWHQAIVTEVDTLLQQQPTLDYALVVVQRLCQLPPTAPFILFALGRMAGWLAHVQEQYRDAALIRPRARYVGVPPT